MDKMVYDVVSLYSIYFHFMDAKKSTLNIALAFDQNFTTPVYVLLTSIFTNNASYHISFHVIAEGLDKITKDDISLFVEKNNGSISYYSVEKKVVQQFILSKDAPHVTSATYYRLFFPELVSESINYLLYLDTDIIVIGDLGRLFQTSLSPFPLGAVADPKIIKRPDLGIDNGGGYFNAGVLLIDLKEWKRQRVTEKTVEFLNSSGEKIVLGDQDALNFVLANNWHKLQRCYNVTFYDIPIRLKRKELTGYLKDKVIIHYTTQHKPWLLTSHNRLRYLYYDYFRKSPQAGSNMYADVKLRKKYWYKLFKRQLKELLVDLGIPL
jgi:lipopolysaccharide biosynthesis glycosyltransferase